MAKTEKLYQQGDVLLKARKRLPSGLKPVKRHQRGWVVAEGEATGHAHVFESTDVQLYEDDQGTIWVKVSEPAALKHEEHNAQTVAPGVYRADIVREVDPFSEEVHRVQD